MPAAPFRYVFTYNPYVVPEDIVRDVTSVSDRVESQRQVHEPLAADLPPLTEQHRIAAKVNLLMAVSDELEK